MSLILGLTVAVVLAQQLRSFPEGVWIVVKQVFFAFFLAYAVTLGWHCWVMYRQIWPFGKWT
jgi:hypothetical protein